MLIETVNIPSGTLLDSLFEKHTILRMDTNGVVFDDSFNVQQSDNLISNPTVKSKENHNQEAAIPDSSENIDLEQNQNIQTILVNCPDLQDGELLNNYILSQLKFQVINDILNLYNMYNTLIDIWVKCFLDIYEVEYRKTQNSNNVNNFLNRYKYVINYINEFSD